MEYRGEIELTPAQRRSAMACLPFEEPKLAVIGHIADDGSFAERLDRALTRSGHNPAKPAPKLITYRPAEPGKGLSTYSGSPDGRPSEGEDA